MMSPHSLVLLKPMVGCRSKGTYLLFRIVVDIWFFTNVRYLFKDAIEVL